MKSKFILLYILSCIPSLLFATIVLKNNSKRKVSLNAYIEAFYTYDFNIQAKNNQPRLDFLYNHHTYNFPNVNLAFAKVFIEKTKFRSNLGLMYGTYQKYNLAAEPTFFKYIYEANVGFKLSKKKNIWLDAGILPSHIGFEYAKGIDNYNLTRSIIAENSPYFETGLSLSYKSKNEKIYLATLVLNGWQKIRWTKNTIPALGIQFTYTPTSTFSINYSNYLGINQPIQNRKLRFFQDVYCKIEENKWSALLGFDIGIEQEAFRSKHYLPWYGLSFMLKYKVNRFLALATRVETYQDKYNIMIPTINSQSVQTSGLSFNFDLNPIKRVTWRNEIKWYYNQGAIYSTKSTDFTNHNFSFCTVLAFDL